MNTLTSPDQVGAVLDRWSHLQIVLHGTPQRIEHSDWLEPQICQRPAADTSGNIIDWNSHPPIVFAASTLVPDLAIFAATIYGRSAPNTSGCKIEGTPHDPRMTFRVTSEVKRDIRGSNPTGWLCILLAGGFRESPLHSWAELVSPRKEHVIGVYAVKYSAMSVELDSMSTDPASLNPQLSANS